MTTSSLYERLGGTAGIQSLVDDILAAHLVNDAIKARFLAVAEEPEKLAVAKQHLCHFLEAGSGGPAEYTGRSMPAAHKGMNISDGEYMSAIDDIMHVLQAHGIEESAQKDVLYISWSLKAEIAGL